MRQRAVLYQLFPIEDQREPLQWCVGPGARLVGRRCRPDQIELPSDPLVSSRHASITNDGGKFAICDENSRNGTFVNRRRISPLHPFLLTDNDVIRVGGTLLLFRLLQDDVPFCTDTPRDFVVRSLEMHDVLHYARQATARGGAILILGESGTGKEKVARYIHDQSAKTKQRTGPLIAVNCATLTPELATSALFGHRKGSFTGAHADHQGFFVAADNGTLFLDEIGEVPTTVQAHLLRALAEKNSFQLERPLNETPMCCLWRQPIAIYTARPIPTDFGLIFWLGSVRTVSNCHHLENGARRSFHFSFPDSQTGPSRRCVASSRSFW